MLSMNRNCYVNGLKFYGVFLMVGKKCVMCGVVYYSDLLNVSISYGCVWVSGSVSGMSSVKNVYIGSIDVRYGWWWNSRMLCSVVSGLCSSLLRLLVGMFGLLIVNVFSVVVISSIRLVVMRNVW